VKTRPAVGPVIVSGGIGALMLVAGVILLSADPCIKDSTAGCNPGSHTTFWAGALTIVGFLTFFIAAWVYWFSRPPKVRAAPRAADPASQAGISAGDHGYTSGVRAVTPQGITVTRPRCCRNGHATPDQAVSHAAQIQQRIELSGR